MSGSNYQDDAENDAVDDRELPDESDMDCDGDDEDEETEPCPHCHKPVYAEAPHCPYCRVDISWERVRSQKSPWLVVIIGVCLILILIIYIL